MNGESVFAYQAKAEVMEQLKGGPKSSALLTVVKTTEETLPKPDAPPAEMVSVDFVPSPTEGENTCWTKPGPKAGPFSAKLADGSTVLYSWYRFIDQPSLQDADLDDAQRLRLQSAVEKIHAQWTPDRDYLPPPASGAIAVLDPALLVKPPPGLEIGYVPIVTGQLLR